MSSAEARYAPALDLAVLDRLRQLAPDAWPDLLAELTDSFRVEARERLDTLRAAADAGNRPAAGQVGHSLKGICGALGAVRMGDLSHEIELFATAGRDLPGWNLEALEAEYHRVIDALTAVTN
ncbi:MAG TPA: Hpt domain-containing protein [Vicinamibacterales bacterium]|nr:Hpt domain-containing protein [Vicinamibacterales bacterium]